jgi:hypothetical protein
MMHVSQTRLPHRAVRHFRSWLLTLLAVSLGAADAVSYTHLTLPTKA